MITRKLGSILRGNATPFQLTAACVLGSLLGFAPGFMQAPALYVLLIAALLVLDANLAVAGLLAVVMRLVSFLVVPVSFAVGEFLLDGPTSGIAEIVVNAPILAWCGFQYYAVAGGQLLGLVLGLVLGFLLVRGVKLLRARMAEAEKNPSKWGEVAQKRWARFGLWLVFGKKGKQSWEEKLARRKRNPVRIWGATLLVVLLVGGWVAQDMLAEPLARKGLVAGLERANGATADVGPVELSLGDGRFSVSELALADPNDLDRNVFSAEKLEADIEQADLLRRRLHIATIVVSEAKSGTARATPGVRTVPEAEAEEPAPAPGGDPQDKDEWSLEEVLADVDIWKERLLQGRRWLDKLAGSEGGEEEDEESYSERLERQIREQGWLSVEAGHLLEQAPTLRLSDLRVDGLEAEWLAGRVFDLNAQELSSHPRLVDAPPRLELNSRDGQLGVVFDLAPVSAGGGDGRLHFHWKGLAVDEAMAQLKLPGGAPLSGGTLDLEVEGAWAEGRIGWVDLPLRVTFHGTTFSMEGIGPTALEELVLPIGLYGPIQSPTIRFDASVLADALAEAGQAELARRLQSELGGRVGEALEKSGLELPADLEEGVGEQAKGLLDSLGGKKKDG